MKKSWFETLKSNLLRGIFVSCCRTISYSGVFEALFVRPALVSYCSTTTYFSTCGISILAVYYI